jgi:hypothetical protein
LSGVVRRLREKHRMRRTARGNTVSSDDGDVR